MFFTSKYPVLKKKLSDWERNRQDTILNQKILKQITTYLAAEKDEQKRKEINNILKEIQVRSPPAQVYFLSKEENFQYTQKEQFDFWQSVTGSQSFDSAKYIKKMWNKKVNRSFIKKIITIHWQSITNISYTLEKLSRRNELSAEGYLKPPFVCHWSHGIGLQIQGRVTWGSNKNVWTAPLVDRKDPKYSGRKYAILHEDVVLDKTTFRDPSTKRGINEVNEFLVCNWKPVALIIDTSFPGVNYASIRKPIEKLADVYKIKVIDFLHKELYVPQ